MIEGKLSEISNFVQPKHEKDILLALKSEVTNLTEGYSNLKSQFEQCQASTSKLQKMESATSLTPQVSESPEKLTSTVNILEGKLSEIYTHPKHENDILSTLKSEINKLEEGYSNLRTLFEQCQAATNKLQETETVTTSILELKLSEFEKNIMRNVNSIVESHSYNQEQETLKAEIMRLNKCNHELETKNSDLLIQYKETDKINKQLTEQNIILEEENRTLKTKVYDLENQLKSKRNSDDQKYESNIPIENKFAALETLDSVNDLYNDTFREERNNDDRKDDYRDTQSKTVENTPKTENNKISEDTSRKEQYKELDNDVEIIMDSHGNGINSTRMYRNIKTKLTVLGA